MHLIGQCERVRNFSVHAGPSLPTKVDPIHKSNHADFCCAASVHDIYIIKERLETSSSMESYLPTSDRHAASWIFSDGPRQPVGVVKLRYNALKLFFDNVAI